MQRQGISARALRSFVICEHPLMYSGGSKFRTFEYQIHSNSERFEDPFSNGLPFKNRTFENRIMASLDRFVYKENFYLYIKRPRLKGPF